ncbi:MAG: hypothetical protein S4CHLAM45_12340 [Chlamydiales bacterium]|nr:hypothetical protein [Chlamydiales bacterium]MCH9619723.1 hypothetical protein [Chlamydiales bacterium]MCH9623329.1 hypothetical protein [Chlamydiales bacterium]
MESFNIQNKSVDNKIDTHQKSISAGECCSSLVVAIVIIGAIAMITCGTLAVRGHLPAVTKGSGVTLIAAGSLLFCILVGES